VTPELAATLGDVARAAAGLPGPWWLIGSAAAVLLGLDETPADVDVLTGEADARRLIAALGAAPLPADGTPLFRSTVFAQIRSTPVAVDVMGGFEVRTAAGWTRVWPATRVAVGGVFIPDAAEQARICRLFGRPKDLARAARLEAIAGG
jgi:hypothetical protein